MIGVAEINGKTVDNATGGAVVGVVVNSLERLKSFLLLRSMCPIK